MLSEERIKELWGMHSGETYTAFERTARAIEAAVLPEGWVAVPREPTEEMLDKCLARYVPTSGLDRECMAGTSTFKRESVRYDYKAMLAAAPKPAQAEKQEPYKRGMTLQECADAEYKQEPVAWMVDTSYDRLIFQNAEQAEHFASKWDIAVVPLYTRPQPDLTAEVEFMQGKYEEMLEEWLPQKQRIAELEAQDTEMCDVHAQLLVEHGKAKLHIAALEEATREARDALQYKLHAVEAIAKLDAVLGDAALRGDSGLIAGVPLESTVMQKEDK